MSSKVALTTFMLLFFYASSPIVNSHLLKICKFDRIYQLGDSISDTGNLIREHPIGANSTFAKLPYGETFFKKATGRCSNGLLMIDYIAMSAGLPLLEPYKNTAADFKHGVNFAVAGSTALSSRVLENRTIVNPFTASSLDVQLGWMSSHFDSICSDHRDCAEKLHNALFMVGEIGGNDYNYAIFEGKNVEELRNMTSDIVDVIMEGVKKVISYGATRVVVPGNFPIGCLPIYKTIFQTNISGAYDVNHCLKHLNDFATFHNDELQKAIHKLQQETPDTMIIYADNYYSYQFLLNFARVHGFNTERSCCGIGGKYNFNFSRMCGTDGVEVCSDPHRYMSWDGIHLLKKDIRSCRLG